MFPAVALLAWAAVVTARPGTLHARACNFFWAAEAGDTCASISDFWGIAVGDFIRWNPSVGAGCANGVVAGSEYCVDFTDDGPTSTTTSTRTTTSTTTSRSTTGTPFPTPIQEGVVSSCTKFYLAKSGDTCIKIVEADGTVTLADFLAWNPAVGSDCSGLWLGYYYCVAAPGRASTTTTSRSATTTGPVVPSPTQPGLSASCNRYHLVSSGDTCDVIRQKYPGAFTLNQFYDWNPAVGRDCASLWLGYYVCIGVTGGTPPSTTTTTSSQPPNPTPQPVQPGIAPNCKTYYLAASGDYCQKIADAYRITLAQFYSWNPAVGNGCMSLWLGYYYCVAV